jgi:asparagine synthase (glutamine-hydrolysing)
MQKALLASADPDTRFVRHMTITPQATRAEILRDPREADTDGYVLEMLMGGPSTPLDRMLRCDLLTYLPGDLLVKMDRASMASSLEVRSPLLDHKLVEFAATLPPEHKVVHGESKVLLREVAKRLMPADIVDRPKHGFSVPIDAWFHSQLGKRFEELVLAPDAALRDHLDQGVAASLLAEHRSGRLAHGHRLWVLLMFELWARRWLV